MPPLFRPRRSLIFLPGLRPDRYPKALASGADVVCVDLEDAIAPQHKEEARAKTLALFAELPDAAGGEVEAMVRINGLRTADGLRDVLAIRDCPRPPPALMLTKVRSADELRQLDELLDGQCAGIRLHVIIETNDGLEDCQAIARACPRIDSLLFGAVDLAAELRTTVAWETLLYARSRLVHAAAGAGLDLIDVPHLDLDDTPGLEQEAAASQALGFTGKAAIHPRQIAVINRCFTPDEATLARARQIASAFAASDTGLVVIDGKLIEPPVMRSVQRVLALAERIGAATPER
jgi:(S)-citramalyl-CoA lyase